MAFEEELVLECDVATALGGIDKKTKKHNPTQVEGYFLGTKTIPDKFSKSGFGSLHIFQTENGRVGVFGKSDSNRRMAGVKPGVMTRIVFDGTKATKFGDMSVFKVYTDKKNKIDVSSLNSSHNAPNNSSDDSSYEADDALDAEEDEPVDEVVPPRPTKPAKAAAAPDADRQARVQVLLNGGKRTA